MAKKKRGKPIRKRPAKPVEAMPKEFLDLIAPAAVRFQTDQMILGDSCRCTLAIRGYPTSTEELALLVIFDDVNSQGFRIRRYRDTSRCERLVSGHYLLAIPAGGEDVVESASASGGASPEECARIWNLYAECFITYRLKA